MHEEHGAQYLDSTQCWKDKKWTSAVPFGNVQLEENVDFISSLIS